MSGFICPKSGKKYDIFGKGTTQVLADWFKISILGQISIEPSVRVGGDEGKLISFYEPISKTALL